MTQSEIYYYYCARGSKMYYALRKSNPKFIPAPKISLLTKFFNFAFACHKDAYMEN